MAAEHEDMECSIIGDECTSSKKTEKSGQKFQHNVPW